MSKQKIELYRHNHLRINCIKAYDVYLMHEVERDQKLGTIYQVRLHCWKVKDHWESYRHRHQAVDYLKASVAV